MSKYFCGWYFKCQNEHQTLAVIPAFHEANGQKSCSIQLVTDAGAWNVPFPYSSFRKKKGELCVSVGDNIFTGRGIRLHLHEKGLQVTGTLKFGELSPISYDIMGPFCYVPFMECRHSIYSMKHIVEGVLYVNGVEYRFHPGVGYIEGDRGRSFPKEYAWTQCSFEGGSIMVSTADIPLGLFHFDGIISMVHWQGKEYRLATYLGAKLERARQGEVVIRQGNDRLSAKLIEKKAKPLCAPVGGAMTRTIRESPSCKAAYSYERNGTLLFSFVSDRASFEFEY